MGNPRVLVTGSSRGIGRAIALALGRSGWSVAVHYNRAESEVREVSELLGDRCSGCYQADLSEPQNAVRLADAVLADGQLHALVNNAGIYVQVDFMGSDDHAFEQAFQQAFAVNWLSALWLTRRCCQAFREQGGGKVLQVASRVGFRGEAGASCYSASKAALINLVRALAVEHAKLGIHHFGIAPGWVETSMAREGMGERLPKILADIPFGRVATPEDCAELAAFLLDDRASYLTGIVVDVNGASYLH